MKKTNYLKFFVLVVGLILHLPVSAFVINEVITKTSIFPTIKKIAAGGYHNCALLRDGSIKCWGKNDFGQIGNNSTTDATQATAVSSLSATAVDVAGGKNHTCAALSTGGVQCWGSNDNGQLGDGSHEDSTKAVNVTGF